MVEAGTTKKRRATCNVRLTPGLSMTHMMPGPWPAADDSTANGGNYPTPDGPVRPPGSRQLASLLAGLCAAPLSLVLGLAVAFVVPALLYWAIVLVALLFRPH
jgi:hypothetical protein